MSTNFVIDRLTEWDRSVERVNMYEKNPLYVPPKELSLGVGWNLAQEPDLVSCKFQYISIIGSIQALFQRKDFREKYLRFNNPNNQSSVNGVYTSFNDGSVYKNNELFSTDPYALQLHLATADLEVSNTLCAKATLHKLTAYYLYLSVQNVSPEYASKLDNVILVCLCHVDD